MEPEWLSNLRDYLCSLKDATNAVLQEIHAERTTEVPFRRGGVNWADLRCVSAEWTVDNDGDHRYCVNVEEVAPDEYELQKEVGKRLADRGFIHIDVVTAW